ncbi:WXG100 family type VII secretion target [Streptomyces sp. SBT349]|uniref:WXG100 family type VII secretion target n=1 Tax=Streptomyces sp. SBT349 TaxID=1580539 RepID=UPI00066C6BA4|nr:WXG100 family type VII secretion target [Streptomyces sp. SBT349]
MSDQMPSDHLRQSDETINALLNSLDQEIGLLNTSRGKLESATDQVIAGWRGDAANTFSSGQQEANLNLDRLIRALDNLRELVRMSRNDFDAQEQDQIAEMMRAQSGLSTMNSSGFENTL